MRPACCTWRPQFPGSPAQETCTRRCRRLTGRSQMCCSAAQQERIGVFQEDDVHPTAAERVAAAAAPTCQPPFAVAVAGWRGPASWGQLAQRGAPALSAGQKEGRKRPGQNQTFKSAHLQLEFLTCWTRRFGRAPRSCTSACWCGPARSTEAGGRQADGMETA